MAADLIWPEWAMYEAWRALLPGFEWLTWPSFLLGLVESVLYGLYTGVLFAPLYNLFSRRFAAN